MILNFTEEQIKAIVADAPEWAKCWAITKEGAISFFSDEKEYLRPDWDNCFHHAGDIANIEIENWRELKFEIKREGESPLMECKCACGTSFKLRTIHDCDSKDTTDVYESKEAELKPVNEACLFKPILVRQNTGSWRQVILIGKTLDMFDYPWDVAVPPSRVQEYAFGFYGVPTRYQHAKRLEGYVYGDES